MEGLEALIVNLKELKRRYGSFERKQKDFITLNPLQTGGKLTEAAKKALLEYGDGYSICDYCKGSLDKIQKPPVFKFVHEDLPEFLGADEARVTHGAREGKFMVMHTITNPGDTIILDQNAHYSSMVAAQRAELKVVVVDHSGEPERIINVEDYVPLIKEHRPSLVLLTYPDGNVGNLPDAKRLGKIAKEHNVPYMLNAAYAIGRMPISMKDIEADFIVGSGQKSMASSGPIGVLGTTKYWSEKLFKESPEFKGKEVECLGCTVRGTPLATLMASFPYVVERVQNWDKEVKKARWFSSELESLGGIIQLGENPHNHDLMMFSTDIFYKISQVHPKRRAFLYDTLKENGIFGLKHGLTKSMKISTFGTPKEDLQKVIDIFRGVINEYGKKTK